MNMKGKKFKTSLCIFGYLLDESCLEIWWFFLNFGQILAIEIPKRHMVKPPFVSNFVCWIFIIPIDVT
jgi:hypothetical protein